NWDPQFKLINVFDTPLLQDLFVTNEYEFQTKLDASEIYEPAGTAWSLLKLNNYHYTQIGGGGPNAINELNPQEVVVYPNPAHSEVQVPNTMLGSDVQIIDASGRVVLSLSNISSTSIDLTAVEAGAYHLSIISNDKRYMARVVVTK
ncbi:MAG: T9SS type A sorting domain-containing protein, partial [Flavobacteriales bacterium]